MTFSLAALPSVSIENVTVIRGFEKVKDKVHTQLIYNKNIEVTITWYAVHFDY